jgi:FOG: PKD repeat
MEDRMPAIRRVRAWTVLLVAVLIVSAGILPVMADDTSGSLGTFPGHSDISNMAFANAATGAYYFKFDQTGGGGINAVHISSTAGASPNYGDVTTTTTQSGTFYVTETGGRGYQDEAILMVAVKKDIPGNFTIHIRSCGYSWTPTGVSNQQPTLTNITYHDGAVDQTFGPSQFVYGPQNWRPAGNNAPSNYPLYNGQDTTDTSDTYDIMFVDLKAGPLGSNGALDTTSLQNNGAIRVDYTITGLNTVATFDVYAWNEATSQGNGISWTNGLTSGSSVPSMISGYTVLGPAYAGYASEFPTAVGQQPEYKAPQISLAASTISGPAPLEVAFTGSSQQSVKTWGWDFGDGGTAAVAATNHTFSKAGTYTVTLTGTGPRGLSTSVTQAITVTAGGSSSGSGGAGGSASSDNSGSATSAGSVSFTANVTAGVRPVAVGFNDTSTIRNITNWTWDFTGDGIPEGFGPHPVYVYKKAGNYSVSLAVNTSEGKAYNLSVPGYILILDAASANSDVGWISSDQTDDSQSSADSSHGPVEKTTAVGAVTPATGSTKGSSPLGTKVAEMLLDALIIVGVIGAGVFFWKKR